MKLPDHPLEHARKLVLRYGWNATSYQILNPGMELWFSRDANAVIGYVRWNRRRIVAGAPVCADADLAAVVREWESESRQAGDEVCYFGAAGRLEALISGSKGYSTVILGTQPVWNPVEWPRIARETAGIRAQLNRAANKGVRVSEWSPARCRKISELRACLTEWLHNRGLPPLHFLVEPETLNRTYDRRIFVAESGSRVAAFLVMSPVPARNGWLTEQFPRRPSAPNGTIELLIDKAMRTLGGEGFKYVTMGLVPLGDAGQMRLRDNPFWLKALLAWVRAHGRRFYDFEGLERFKAKLKPESWEPIYAISNSEQFSPGTLYAIASAFTAGAPALAVARGIGKALRQELRWISRSLRFDTDPSLR
jgi:phosphatidylglycerol lysyltransferase